MPLKSKLGVIARALPKELDRAARKGAERVKQVRDPLTPVDTAALLESGEVVAGPALGHWIFREGDGLPDARASYTEYGTDKAPAQPHVTPAAERVKRELPGLFTGAVREAVSKGRI